MTEEEVRVIVNALVPAMQEAVDKRLAHERTAGELALRTALGPLGERLAALEAKPATPGPAGEKGQPGAPGTPGRDGLDGRPGLTYCGVYVEGRSYERGECVTYAGSLWHANAEATTKPGDGSKDWTLVVKRGRDGKDARP